jgi:hypothetical protein
VVPPKLNATLTKISLRDATGRGSQRHSFRYVANWRLYPCSITGAAELGYLPGVRPFNSEVHSTSALLPCFQTAVIPDRVPGSLEIALKCTCPRQRFFVLLGGILCERRGCVKGLRRTDSGISAGDWVFRSGWAVFTRFLIDFVSDQHIIESSSHPPI